MRNAFEETLRRESPESLANRGAAHAELVADILLSNELTGVDFARQYAVSQHRVHLVGEGLSSLPKASFHSCWAFHTVFCIQKQWLASNQRVLGDHGQTRLGGQKWGKAWL